MKTIITNGIIVSYDKSDKADIAFEDNVITEIAANINKENAKVIDAQGCYILPGGVDMHTNLGLDQEGNFSAKAFRQNSLAALYGGTTTVIEEVEDTQNDALKNLHHYINELKSQSYCDYSFHLNYFDSSKDQDLIEIITHGFPSAFLSMHGKNAKSDKEILNFVRTASPYGGTTFIHAQSKEPISLLEELHTLKKRTSPYALATSRPSYAEKEAFERIFNLARAGGFTFALEAVSTKEVVDMLYKQVNEGLPVTLLTSPHYLVLDDNKYLSNNNIDEETYKYCVEPPLRKTQDIEALWKAINNGLIHCIISKHNGIHLSHKTKFTNNIFNVPMGMPSVELRLPLLHTLGVLSGKISINKLVEITATHVTRIAGLRSKGRIEAGTDADIVIFDPNHKKTITKDILHDSADYTPYEGLELQGFAKQVFLRGKEVINNFEAVAENSSGELIFRKAVAMR